MLDKLKSIREHISKNLRVSSLFNIYLIILCVTIFLFCTHSVMVTDLSHNYVDYKDGWVTSDGVEIDLEDITVSTSVFNVIPAVDKNTAIFFRVKNLNVSVYIDGDLYRDYGKELLVNEQYYKTPGTYYVMIPLNEADEGKCISIVIDCPDKSDSSCNITLMRI